MTGPLDLRSPTGVGQTRLPHLLVSVASPLEAVAAVDGDADIIDAKDPRAGPLGAVTLDVLRAIVGAVDAKRPVSAALGDATGEDDIERAAREYARAGAHIVKVGFAGTASRARVAALLRAAVRGAQEAGGGVVAVAYADASAALSPEAILDAAAASDAVGVLIDTADKIGPPLPALVTPGTLRDWVARAHDAGVWASVAGGLTAGTLASAADAGADVVGVRGAACDGGRHGAVSIDRVRLLRARLTTLTAPAGTAPLRGDRRVPSRPTLLTAAPSGSTGRRDRRPTLPVA